MPARRLALSGQRWGWLALCQYILGETVCSSSNFYLGVALRTTLRANPSLRYTSMLLAINNFPQEVVLTSSPLLLIAFMSLHFAVHCQQVVFMSPHFTVHRQQVVFMSPHFTVHCQQVVSMSPDFTVHCQQVVFMSPHFTVHCQQVVFMSPHFTVHCQQVVFMSPHFTVHCQQVVFMSPHFTVHCQQVVFLSPHFTVHCQQVVFMSPHFTVHCQQVVFMSSHFTVHCQQVVLCSCLLTSQFIVSRLCSCLPTSQFIVNRLCCVHVSSLHSSLSTGCVVFMSPYFTVHCQLLPWVRCAHTVVTRTLTRREFVNNSYPWFDRSCLYQLYPPPSPPSPLNLSSPLLLCRKSRLVCEFGTGVFKIGLTCPENT